MSQMGAEYPGGGARDFGSLRVTESRGKLWFWFWVMVDGGFLVRRAWRSDSWFLSSDTRSSF